MILETFFQLVKNDVRAYEKFRKVTIGQDDDCTTGCFLDYPYLKKNCEVNNHSIISLSHHEQVCLMRLRFERHFSHHWAMLMILMLIQKHLILRFCWMNLGKW